MYEHNWDEMIKGGVNIARVEIESTQVDGAVYKIKNDDGTFVVFTVDGNGWTYYSYDEVGNQVGKDQGERFADIAARIVSFVE